MSVNKRVISTGGPSGFQNVTGLSRVVTTGMGVGTITAMDYSITSNPSAGLKIYGTGGSTITRYSWTGSNFSSNGQSVSASGNTNGLGVNPNNGNIYWYFASSTWPYPTGLQQSYDSYGAGSFSAASTSSIGAFGYGGGVNVDVGGGYKYYMANGGTIFYIDWSTGTITTLRTGAYTSTTTPYGTLVFDGEHFWVIWVSSSSGNPIWSIKKFNTNGSDAGLEQVLGGYGGYQGSFYPGGGWFDSSNNIIYIKGLDFGNIERIQLS
jgi:hypothetical protein